MAARSRRPARLTTASIRWEHGALSLLDQTALPAEERWLRCECPEDVAEAIRRLVVRGAPGIGIAAAFGLALVCAEPMRGDSALLGRVDEVVELLSATRPTAGELRSTLDAGRAELAQALPKGEGEARAALLAYAEDVCEGRCEAMQALVEIGAPLLSGGDRVLTHCNTGAIATGARHGTALGIVQAAHRAAPLDTVWVDETRPLLQGSRLTAWELDRAGVPYRIVTDASVGALMARGFVDVVLVGADRIAANGDVANKIGTYTVAVMAHRHDVPLVVAAPRSTFDLGVGSGDEIPIERRSPEEVTEIGGQRVAPPDAEVLNLAFDVTPAELVSAIATDAGVLRPPFEPAIADAFSPAAHDPALAKSTR
ncbi:MAG: S-methyl-5-thioribose-1-phosphate isomerase [Actinomycetota bacterium]|nr:S-methyl-5-thioribose-1-phosphate isomerase [Actinomycetota bacterium]